jgi:integrase/recombinase XerD
MNNLIKQPNKNVPTGLRNKAILSFIWDSGARVSDIVNLKTGNINIGKREVTVIGGKGDVDRNLSFSDYTGGLLKKYKEARPKGEYFFCTLQGNKLDRVYLYSMIRRYAKRIGIDKKIGLHTLRHSFALKFYKDSGHDLIRLQKILGHKNINTTEIYCYMDKSVIKEGLEAYYSKRDSKNQDIKDKIKFLEEEIRSLKASIWTTLA